jgi:hypothetical protein
MRQCFSREPKNRPSFKTLVEKFSEFTRPNFRQVSFTFTVGRAAADSDASEPHGSADVTTPLCSDPNATQDGRGDGDVPERGAASRALIESAKSIKRFFTRPRELPPVMDDENDTDADDHEVPG